MFPIKPNFKPIVSTSERQRIFGKFEFIAKPIPGNKENIVITGNWYKENVITVTIPQLAGIKGAPASHKVLCHKLAAPSLIAMWQEFEAKGFLPLILTWGGTFCPRFQRGSTTALSNHSFATAFDINMEWNGFGQVPALEGHKGCVYELVAIANKYGWYWGGHFNRQDGMHFEYTGGRNEG